MTEQNSGYKFDDGKLNMSLIDPYFIEDLAKVLTEANKKYKPFSWRVVLHARSRYIKALDRHLLEIKKGVMYDDDSGLPHTAHVAACAMFINYFDRKEYCFPVQKIDHSEYYSYEDITKMHNELPGMVVQTCDEQVPEGFSREHLINLIEGELNIKHCRVSQLIEV